MCEFLKWQEDEGYAVTYEWPTYIWKIKNFSNSSQECFILGDAFKYFDEYGWKPLSVSRIKVGWFFWKREVNYWIFIREH